jgi:hypothetical protein
MPPQGLTDSAKGVGCQVPVVSSSDARVSLGFTAVVDGSCRAVHMYENSGGNAMTTKAAQAE